MPVATILLWGKNLLNNWIEPISAIIGIITFVPILMTLYEVKFGRKYKYAGWFNQVKNSTGSRPAIFIIDLKLNADIRTQVQKAIEADEKLKSIPNDRIFQVCRSEMLSPKDMPDLVSDIRTGMGEIMKSGIDTVHLFYAGPVSPMAIVGAEFANCCRVILYQHYQGEYTNFGPLKHI